MHSAVKHHVCRIKSILRNILKMHLFEFLRQKYAKYVIFMGVLEAIF